MNSFYTNLRAGLSFLAVLSLLMTPQLNAQGCLDAAFFVGGNENNAHFFRGDETRAHGWASNTSSSTKELGDRWTGLTGWTGIDAALSLLDGRILAFRGSEMANISANTKMVITAPAPITNFINFFPAHFREGIDAAFAWPNGSNDDLQIFFFKGKEYVKVDFNVPNNSFTNPQPATSGGWGGVFTNHFTEGIDAALYHPASNKVYFFRGNKYIRYDAGTGSIDQGYPLPTSDPQNWGNLFADWSCIDPQANITCSMNYKVPDNSCSDANEVEFNINGIQPTVLGTNIQVENVVIYIEHPFVSDLTLTLISPNGVEVVLADGVGGNGSNFGTSCNGPDLTVFSRTASQSISQGSAPFKGEFRPQGDLDDFNDGSNPNGIWKLRMCDNADDDIGTLIGFRLSLTSIATGIEDVVEKGIGMTVAPNPSQGRMTVSFAQKQAQDVSFDVLDVAGKVVFHYEQAQAGTRFETSFDLSQLPNGIFFLRARSGTLVTTERFLIQK